MNSVPDEVCRRLQAADQSHLTMWWGHLTVAQQQTLLQQIQKLDLEQIGRLTDRTGDHHAPPKAQPPADRVSRATAPSMVIRQPQTPEEARAREEAAVVGRQLLGEGKVAVVTVAGGQGSRLGFEHPKGMYPIGPLTSRSLFQIFAEQIQARSKKCGRDIPWLIMTSSTTHDETTAFFEAHHYFGLQRDQVFFFPQADLPAVDAATGKLLLREKHELNLAPDGHGGLVTALAAHGLLDRLAVMGIEDVFYHQVDNPAVIICDPVLIGLHRIHRSELTTNVVRKLEPSERMGVLAEVDGRIEIIEYSEMSLEDASRTDANGDWIFWAGNTAIHVFSLEFLRRLTSGDQQLELHV
ncbi:MAG: UTP--glucose-1-phosphate uridylyltransferase, partial [Planctomycetaceae bacterium]|nr:UTP--glucose-1-phosphate uridylyltransferase [Planctomycetaceae bacterium]